MRQIRVTGPARRDITKTLRHSSAEFGDQARQRYRGLTDQALKDLGADANRVGVQSIDHIRKSYFLYHLKWSRKAPAGPPVHQPRHLIAFYFDNSDNIIVARVFHERQMLSQHLTESDDH
ncbi:MAG: type II toxin-antitoxin system RelE/ParE family toxin [Pseudomonadota bacterium]